MIRQEKAGLQLFWLAPGLQTIQCVVLKKFSREELTSFVNSVTLSDNHRVFVWDKTVWFLFFLQNNTNGHVLCPEGWSVDRSTYLHHWSVDWWGYWYNIVVFKTRTHSYVDLKLHVLPSTVFGLKSKHGLQFIIYGHVPIYSLLYLF